MERFVRTEGADVCVETFGDPADPAIVLVHGVSASMLWWERELCEAIAAPGRLVIRFDQRDTGRSTHWPPGSPGYALSDLVADVVAVLDALGVAQAHVVGRSMGVAVAVALGVDHSDRVATLTFVGATTGADDLPPMSAEFLTRASAEVDPADDAAVVDHVVELLRTYAGRSPHFDEAAVRAVATADVARTASIASTLANHFLIDFDAPRSGGLADVIAPTLVVHGDSDPVFPLPHGEAVRDGVPGAQLVVLPDTGHDVPRAVWPEFVAALVDHTTATA